MNRRRTPAGFSLNWGAGKDAVKTKKLVAVFVRWLTALALGLWLGGIVFLGAVTAPQIFRFLRSHHAEPLAPSLFGEILARFAVFALVLGGVALLGWLLDGLFSKPQGRGQLLWKLQGGATLLMLAISLYLQAVALPSLLLNQDAVIQESIKTGVALSARGVEGKSEMRRRYDALHRNYTTLTMAVFYIGAASLAALMWRLSQQKFESESI